MKWSVLPTISASMSFQMALDELLFREREEIYQNLAVEQRVEFLWAQPPLLRFYYSDRNCATVGYSHKSSCEDRRFMKNGLTYEVVRRITGGGRVEHGQDLVFSLVAHKHHDASFHSVRVSYWKIHEALKAGFEELGLKTRFYRCDEDLPEGPECFRYPISSDLALGRDKVAGGSQKRSSGLLLHQESVKVPKRVKAENLAEAFKRTFSRVFDIKLVHEPLKPEWFSKARVLAAERYAPLGILNGKTRDF